MQLESMSDNIVKITKELAKNQGLARLLVNHDNNPFNKPVENTHLLASPSSDSCKIFPYPFELEATEEDGIFIRAYYNYGSFDSSEVIAESDIFIDVIVARSLWLIDNGQKALIRPYVMMGLIKDMLGKRSLNSTINLKFKNYQHFYVNPKFDAVRLTCEYMSVET